MADCYQTLNLTRAATPDEIKDAYARERARLIAAEATGDEQAAGQLLVVDEAYATLNDVSRRMAYDRSLDAGTGLVVAGQSAPLVAPQESRIPLVQQGCPHCGGLNPVQATMCIHCGQQMSRPCPNCGHAVVLGQTVCAHCNTFIPEYDQRRYAEAMVVEQRAQQERMESDARVAALEATHRKRAIHGAIFWIVALGLCLGLTALALVVFGMASRGGQ